MRHIEVVPAFPAPSTKASLGKCIFEVPVLGSDSFENTVGEFIVMMVFLCVTFPGLDSCHQIKKFAPLCADTVV